MDLCSSLSKFHSPFPSLTISPQFSLHPQLLQIPRNSFSQCGIFLRKPLPLPPPFSRQNNLSIRAAQVPNGIENDDFVLEDVPHLTDFLPNLPDCCLIPESPFYLEGRGGLFEFIEQRLKENGHLVIVVAEGAGQEYIAAEVHAAGEKDASGNKLLLDVGPWLSNKIKDHFSKVQKMAINMKYIDPTYMIRAIPSNASDNIYCTLLAHSVVHGAMAGYTGFTVGPVNSKHAYIPIARVTETQNTVKLTDRMWARVLESTNQPSFVASDHERIDNEIIKV